MSIIDKPSKPATDTAGSAGRARSRRHAAGAPGIERPTRRSRRTRAELVAAARAVLEEEGLATLTVREVTGRADVGHGTFYHHFGSTEEILGAVVGVTIREMAEDLAHELSDVDDQAWVLVQSLARTVAVLLEHPARDALLERPVLLADALRENLSDHAQRDIAAWAATDEIDASWAERLGSLWPWLIVGTLTDIARDPRRADELVRTLVAATLATLRLGEARTAELLARLRPVAKRRTTARRKVATASGSRNPPRGGKTS